MVQSLCGNPVVKKMSCGSSVVLVWYPCCTCKNHRNYHRNKKYCISCYFREGLFSRFSRARPSRKFPLQFMSIYSNDNISKIAKLTTRELPQKSKNAKITVRENNGLYSIPHTFCGNGPRHNAVLW